MNNPVDNLKQMVEDRMRAAGTPGEAYVEEPTSGEFSVAFTSGGGLCCGVLVGGKPNERRTLNDFADLCANNFKRWYDENLPPNT